MAAVTKPEKRKKKKQVLRVIKEECVGKMSIEEAFRKAFEPYFNPNF